MDNIIKFEDFLDRMQGLLDNAKKQGHIIVRVEDLENTFPELKESEDEEKPNGGIVLEDFNEGNGFYKVNLSYLNKEQVEEIENIVKKWNHEPVESEDERIRKALIRFHKSSIDIDGIKGDDILAWLEKQGESSDQIHYWTEEEIEPIISDYLRGAEHYGGMIGRLRCLKPKSLEKQGEQKPADKDMIEALHTEYEKGRADAIAEMQKGLE